MLADYIPILFFIVIVVAFAVGSILLSEFFGKRFAARGKGLPYESGMSSGAPERARFSIHYYVIAVLFILFDIEAIFLIPWAVAAQSLGKMAFFAVVTFLAILMVGLIYVWKKGALTWER